jgi:hypothetical protein
MNLNHLETGPRPALGFGLVLMVLATIVTLAHLRPGGARLELELLADLQQRAALADQWQGMTKLHVGRTIVIAMSGNLAALADHVNPLIKATSARITEVQASPDKRTDSTEVKALVEQPAAAASSLNDQATRLTQAVSAFRLGWRAATPAPARATGPRRVATTAAVPAHKLPDVVRVFRLAAQTF